VEANGQALTPNRISSSLLYEWFTARRQAYAWSSVRWAHVDAGSLGETVSHLGKGYPRIGAIYRSNVRDSAMCSRYETIGLPPSPASVGERGGNLARSVHPLPDPATQPGHREVPTLERFNSVHEANFAVGSRLTAAGKAAVPSHQVFCTAPSARASASGISPGLGRPLSRNCGLWTAPPCSPAAPGSSASWSTSRATPTPATGRHRLAGPAGAWIIGLGLSGSARRRGTAKLCSPQAFTGQFPRSAMVSTKTTREEEERVF